jgi:hypothetical protein
MNLHTHHLRNEQGRSSETREQILSSSSDDTVRDNVRSEEELLDTPGLRSHCISTVLRMYTQFIYSAAATITQQWYY